MSNRLSYPEPFLPEGYALSEHAQLGMARGELGTGKHGGRDDLTEALAATRPLKGRHSLPKAANCASIVALGLVDKAEALARPRVQDDIAAGCGEREGALGSSDGLVIRAHDAEMD